MSVCVLTDLTIPCLVKISKEHHVILGIYIINEKKILYDLWHYHYMYGTVWIKLLKWKFRYCLWNSGSDFSPQICAANLSSIIQVLLPLKWTSVQINESTELCPLWLKISPVCLEGNDYLHVILPWDISETFLPLDYFT